MSVVERVSAEKRLVLTIDDGAGLLPTSRQ